MKYTRQPQSWREVKEAGLWGRQACRHPGEQAIFDIVGCFTVKVLADPLKSQNTSPKTTRIKCRLVFPSEAAWKTVLVSSKGPVLREAVPASQADSTQWPGSKKNYFFTEVGSGHGEQKLNLYVNLIYENLASVSTFPTKATAWWRLRDNTKSFIQHKKGSEILAWRLPAVGGGLCPAAGEASFSAAEKSFAVTPAPPPPHYDKCTHRELPSDRLSLLSPRYRGGNLKVTQVILNVL